MRPIDADALKEDLTRFYDGEVTAKELIDAQPTILFVGDINVPNKWILVNDKLPEKEGQYLCWFGKNILNKGAAVATYLETWKAFGTLETLETYPNVTHWMPIEPPKEDATSGNH